MDFNQANTEIHIRIQNQLALPPRWDVPDDMKSKITPTGKFADFLGDTIAFELSPSQKAMFEPVLRALALHRRLVVPVSVNNLQMTLRRLANPHTVGINDRNLIQQHISMNQARVPDFFERIKNSLKDNTISLSNGQFTLGPEKADGSYYFRWADPESLETLYALQRLCDMTDPYKKVGADFYIPHITLCYLLPRHYTTQETISIRSMVTDCHYALSSAELCLNTRDIRYFYHSNMNDYRIIR